jgi:RNA polymerase sigma factor (TIGR02999 family)
MDDAVNQQIQLPSRAQELPLETSDDPGHRTLPWISSKLYGDLKRLAKHLLNGQEFHHSSLMTAEELVHESYLRLCQKPLLQFQNRKSFIAYTAKMMRFILFEERRAEFAMKRNRAQTDAFFDEHSHLLAEDDRELKQNVTGLLQKLSRRNARQHQIVVLRFYGGHTREEISKLLNLSPATIAREWRKARQWLSLELGENSNQSKSQRFLGHNE